MTKRKPKTLPITSDYEIIYQPTEAIDSHVSQFSDIATGERELDFLIQEIDNIDPENPLPPFIEESLRAAILVSEIRLGGLRRLERALIEEIERADRVIADLEAAIGQAKGRRRATLRRLNEIQGNFHL